MYEAASRLSPSLHASDSTRRRLSNSSTKFGTMPSRYRLLLCLLLSVILVVAGARAVEERVRDEGSSEVDGQVVGGQERERERPAEVRAGGRFGRMRCEPFLISSM